METKLLDKYLALEVDSDLSIGSLNMDRLMSFGDGGFLLPRKGIFTHEVKRSTTVNNVASKASLPKGGNDSLRLFLLVSLKC